MPSVMAGELLEVLRALLSSDNASRSAAEERYRLLRNQQPEETVSLFLQLLPEPQIEVPVREQAAVLLRQCLSKVNCPHPVWPALHGEQQREVLAKLLSLLEAEREDKVRRKIADVIQSLGNLLIDQDEGGARPVNVEQWPELMPTMMRIIMDNTKAPGIRSDALWAMAEMACSVWQVLVASVEQTLRVLQHCFADQNESVRAHAARLFCETIGCIGSKEDKMKFSPLLPELFAVLAGLAEATSSDLLKLVLQSVAATAEDTSAAYRDCLGSHALPVLCQIAKSHRDDESRRLALEVVCSLAEGRPKMFLKVPGGLRAALEVCVRFLMELDDDSCAAWAVATNVDEQVDGEEQHHFGAEVADRLCAKLRSADCFADAFSVLQALLAELFSQDAWQAKVAGLVLFRQIMEHIDDDSIVAHMLQVVIVQLAAQHPRVRSAAWGCVEQAAQDHSDLVTSEEWCNPFLAEFLKGLADDCPRSLLSCMSAFQHYGENICRDALEPAVPDLMNKLGNALQDNSKPSVQREAITCMAVIAGQIQGGFAKFYAPLMIELQRLISVTMHKVEDRVLLGKAFECISLLANAVGRDIFRPDAEAILSAMVNATQVPNLPKDDPVQEYMMSAAERICSTLREDFLPFVPHILPIVLEKLNAAPEELTGDVVPDNADGDVSLAVVPGEAGDAKILVMSSSELEEIGHAVECIHTFVEKLGQRFAPFTWQTARALLPVFEFSMSEKVRDLAFDTWAQLCHVAREGGETQVLTELVVEFTRRIVPKLREEFNEVARSTMITRADGLTHCLKEAGPNILGDEQVSHLCQLTHKLVSDSFGRQSRRQRGTKQVTDAPKKKEDDEESDDDADEEDEEEQLLRQSSFNCLTAVMTHHPDSFAREGLAVHLMLLQQLLEPCRPLGDRRLGLYGIASISECLSHRLVPHWPSFLERLLVDLTSASSDLQAPACYALSFVVREAAFAPNALEVARRLADIVSSARTASKTKRKLDKSAQMVADNALSALMEILVHHSQVISDDSRLQLWSAWVRGLPCQEDSAEGVRNHQILVQMVSEQMPEVIGTNGSNMPTILSSMVDVYRTEMADDVTSWRIGKLLLNVGEATLRLHAAALSEKQRKKLVRITRDAEKGISPQ